nr:TIGR01459 family HAD-type hydrolase [Limoniibacter endophyticus]
MAAAPRTVETLDALLDDYSVVLCDVWGVLHNGVEAFPQACAALQRARQKGKAVVLITNAPRPNKPVEVQIRGLGVPDDAWDFIVTSGDVTRKLIAEGPRRIFHIGTEREESIYEDLDVELVEEFEADSVVCTGFVDDDSEKPEDYADLLQRLRARNLPFICANPDIVVEKGEKLVWCAGALARDYGLLGGRTFIAGKPHHPIYEAALKAACGVLGREVTAKDALAIGDGILTDIKGAVANGVDALFISGGIHAGEYGDALEPDAGRMAVFLNRHGHMPVATMPRLA